MKKSEIEKKYLQEIHFEIGDPLVAAGAILQYAAFFIPVVGSTISLLIGLFWPENESDVWSQIKYRVSELIGEYIDEERWNICTNKINELNDKLTAYHAELSKGDYDAAKYSYFSLKEFLIGVEENFKIKGNSYEYAFTPLFIAVINLKISFFVESLSAAVQLTLSDDEVSDAKSQFSLFINSAKTYLYPVENSLINLPANDITEYFERNYFYAKYLVFNKFLWDENFDVFINGTSADAYAIPLAAAGVFFEHHANGDTYFMNNFDVRLNAISPASNVPVMINGEIICPSNDYNPGWYLDGFISKISISNDRAIDQRATGLSFCKIYMGQTFVCEMGMLPNNLIFEDYHVDLTEVNFNEDSILNKVNIWSDRYVSRVEVFSTDGLSIICGEVPGSDKKSTAIVDLPYRISSIYVPSDIDCYMKGSGHEMGGIAFVVAYDNELAKKYALNQKN